MDGSTACPSLALEHEKRIILSLSCGVGAQGDACTATISDLLCIPIWYLIIPNSSTTAIWKLPPETSSNKTGETWRGNGRWILYTKHLTRNNNNNNNLTFYFNNNNNNAHRDHNRSTFFSDHLTSYLSEILPVVWEMTLVDWKEDEQIFKPNYAFMLCKLWRVPKRGA
jgi:hypothetical protein